MQNKENFKNKFKACYNRERNQTIQGLHQDSGSENIQITSIINDNVLQQKAMHA